jgi:hypothetical protein
MSGRIQACPARKKLLYTENKCERGVPALRDGIKLGYCTLISTEPSRKKSIGKLEALRFVAVGCANWHRLESLYTSIRLYETRVVMFKPFLLTPPLLLLPFTMNTSIRSSKRHGNRASSHIGILAQLLGSGRAHKGHTVNHKHCIALCRVGFT